MALEPTGERMIVEHFQSSLEDYLLYVMHIAGYRFAELHAHGKRILDYGCGSGYGAARLAEAAQQVCGVDVDEEAVAHARLNFGKPNLRFERVGAAERLPYADRAFDTVLSFQVFEHVSDTVHYLSEVRRVLAPQGILLLITPDRRRRLLPLQKPWNRWHVREYDPRTLQRTLSPFFRQVEMLQMSGRREVIDAELRRGRRLKWLCLPATLPFIPERLRFRLLSAPDVLRGKRSHAAPRRFDFDESAIDIGPGLEPSLNLVAVARG
ncbi:MAG TPA: class I SAM-dependent methyltransferase [Vicinamibacteria bacterium]|nr:class I SAM-dependent methyltransferase [Vicinamibacteria bacterium]